MLFMSCYSLYRLQIFSLTDIKISYLGTNSLFCIVLQLTSVQTHCIRLLHRHGHTGCWRLALSVCSVSGLEQAARVSVSPGGSSYLQPSAGPVNNTCIGLPRASHLTSLPHYNYEPCNPAGELSPAGNSRPGGLHGAQAGGKGKRQLSFPGKKHSGWA